MEGYDESYEELGWPSDFQMAMIESETDAAKADREISKRRVSMDDDLFFRHKNKIFWGLHQSLFYIVSNIYALQKSVHPTYGNNYSIDRLVDSASVTAADIEMLEQACEEAVTLKNKLEEIYDRTIIKLLAVPPDKKI